jgi:cob(I)alamin adenosyltransferase
MSIRINRVYTRSGDDGTTGLVGGERIPKDSLRVAAYGDIDELNSVLGLAKEYVSGHTIECREVFTYIQQELFDLGAELATPKGADFKGMSRISEQQVLALEELCDHFGADLPELRSFILPGGSVFAAFLHQARVVARRAERSIIRLHREDELNSMVIKYVNRLSDLMFVLARWALKMEGHEVPQWDKVSSRNFPIDRSKLRGRK